MSRIKKWLEAGIFQGANIGLGYDYKQSQMSKEGWEEYQKELDSVKSNDTLNQKT